MEVTGRIIDIKDTVQVSEKYKKREFWLEIPSKYPQTIALEFTQGFVEKLDHFSIDQNVNVKFELRGRVWKEKCFNTLQAHAIEPA